MVRGGCYVRDAVCAYIYLSRECPGDVGSRCVVRWGTRVWVFMPCRKGGPPILFRPLRGVRPDSQLRAKAVQLRRQAVDQLGRLERAEVEAEELRAAVEGRDRALAALRHRWEQAGGPPPPPAATPPETTADRYSTPHLPRGDGEVRWDVVTFRLGS